MPADDAVYELPWHGGTRACGQNKHVPGNGVFVLISPSVWASWAAAVDTAVRP